MKQPSVSIVIRLSAFLLLALCSCVKREVSYRVEVFHLNNVRRLSEITEDHALEARAQLNAIETQMSKFEEVVYEIGRVAEAAEAERALCQVKAANLGVATSPQPEFRP